MDKYVEYSRFPNLSSAQELIKSLESNQIHFELDDTALRFDISAKDINPIDNQLIIRIKEADFERVNLLTTNKSMKAEVTSDSDHYLHSFSDNDIIDVIVNQDDWTPNEVELAKKISNQRNLKPTAELIKALRNEKISAQNKHVVSADRNTSAGASWFLWIGILSILNTFDSALNLSVSFIFGLGITQIIQTVMIGLQGLYQGYYIALGFVLSLALSSLFILFWYYAKRGKQWAYLIGIVLYTFDTVIFMVGKDWLSVGFHVFLLFAISSGYNSLIKRK